MSDATNLANLQTRLANIYTELASLPTSPDYSVGGQSVQWDPHRKSLLDEAQQIKMLINQESPYEIRTVAW